MRSYIAVNADPSFQPVPSRPAGADPRLLQLQELDQSIDRLSARLEGLESQVDIREARERTGKVEARLGELRLVIDDVAREQSHLENDLDSMERKIEAERKRMYDGSVVNPKELQSIEAEIQNLTHRRSDKEDRLLEAMERREELDTRLGSLEGEMRESAARLAEIEQSSGRELGEVRQAVAQRASERDVLAAQIDPDLLELYEDLRRQKKGVGVASLANGVCQGCHQKLSPMYLDRLKRSQDIWRCEYCRRILVAT